jgi:hypothetical protein
MTFTPSRNETVNRYIEELDESIQPLFVAVRDVVLKTTPTLDENIKWKNCLTYSIRKNVIQTVVGKGKVSLIFFDGASIDDPQGLLDGDGKTVRTMRIVSDDFDKAALRSYVRQAVKLAA